MLRQDMIGSKLGLGFIEGPMAYVGFRVFGVYGVKGLGYMESRA